MKILFQTFWIFLLSAVLIFAPRIAYAAEITMGSNGNLVFVPSELTISAGESVTITNGDLPPHNFVVADHPELSHPDLAFVYWLKVQIDTRAGLGKKKRRELKNIIVEAITESGLTDKNS